MMIPGHPGVKFQIKTVQKNNKINYLAYPILLKSNIHNSH
jgi:hypothetical protein